MLSTDPDMLDFIDDPQDDADSPLPSSQGPWDVLVVDDDPAVLTVTNLVLKDVTFDGRAIALTGASSASEARTLLAEKEYAVLLLDVVMETEHAGLDLVRHMRDVMHNRRTRIIVRTGQPGSAPQERVVHEYDINDYREKTSLTAHSLESSVVAALREYRHIRELEEARAALSAERAVSRAVLDAMPSAVVVCDTEGRVQYWNNEASKLSGLSPDEALGFPFEDIAPALQLEAALLQAGLRTTTPLRQARHASRHGRHTTYRDVVFYPAATAEGRQLVVRIDDVTDRVRMESLMLQTEKMLSLGGLAAGMAHEINNPLAVILQGADTVQRRLAPGLPANRDIAREIGLDLDLMHTYLERRKLPRFIAGIAEAGRRAADIVENMLSFGRGDEGRRCAIDINKVVERALELAAHHYDLKKKYDFRQILIVKDLAEGMPSIVCNPIEMEQVLFNLLQNAAQVLYEAPPQDARPTIHLQTRCVGRLLEIRVTDNGPGVPHELARRIFEPFFTTKPPGMGTGLGLSVSYFIVSEHHGGTLRLERLRLPEHGARFIVELPLDVMKEPGAEEGDDTHDCGGPVS